MAQGKVFFVAHKKRVFFYLGILVLLSVAVVVVGQDGFLYKIPVVRITEVENSCQKTVGTEQSYSQKITGVLVNGQWKGREIRLNHEYSSSQVYDEEYRKGDQVFVSKIVPGDILSGHISGLKRDQSFAMLLALFFCGVLFVTGKKGIFVALSLFFNVFIFLQVLVFYEKGIDFFFLSNILMVLFAVFSLLLVSGFNRKTGAAIVGTLCSIGLTMLLFFLTMKNTGGVDYGFMEYLSSHDDLPQIFMAQILFGGLGATMDVSITMSSTINELLYKDKGISARALLRSGREVGHDIMGTMINVMLFAYVSGEIPVMLLKMKNHISLVTIVSQHIPFEVYRFLLGGIGILIAIPVSLGVSLFFWKGVGGLRQK